MLTRLKVSGFKNLVDVDVRFGPFTCIAGGNGVGKSNLFDAIRFLSALAEKSLVDAALSLRGEADKISDIRRLFHHANGEYAKTMSFEAEMIIPKVGRGNFTAEIEAEDTFLRYKLVLGYREMDKQSDANVLEIVEEELTPMTLNEANLRLSFSSKNVDWLSSMLVMRRNSPIFFTRGDEGSRVIVFPKSSLADEEKTLPLSAALNGTGLSVAHFFLGDTGELARQEMQSWRVYDWEPSALREPSLFRKPSYLGADGSQMAAAIYRIAQSHAAQTHDEDGEAHDATQIYQYLANRLSELIGDVYRLRVDYDEIGERYTLWITGRDGTEYNARSLSDGTLRFLAYLTFIFDDEAKGVLCFEEPENGLHPERITALLRVLQDIAVDVMEPVGPSNPLRQVIITTHSPGVAQQVPADTFLFADPREQIQDGKWFKGVAFVALPDTWRTAGEAAEKRFSPGTLLPYFNPSPYRWPDAEDCADESEPENGKESNLSEPLRVMDHPRLQRIAPWRYGEE